MNEGWTVLRELFETDDGSLPEIEINNLDGQSIQAIFERLRKDSNLVSKDATLWSESKKLDIALDSVENPAGLVASGETPSFHVVLGGISLNGHTIPDLGVFVFPDAIVLDYRMGDGWNEQTLDSLFRLLVQLKRIAPTARVQLSEKDPFSVKFAAIMNKYERAV